MVAVLIHQARLRPRTRDTAAPNRLRTNARARRAPALIQVHHRTAHRPAANLGFAMSSTRQSLGAFALACACLSTAPHALAAAADYRFELSGAPVASAGKAVVHVRLVHATDDRPVTGAVIFESTADMGPMGMAAMTGPVRAMPPHGADYAFEVEPGMTGTWALHLSAKVEGETETVQGTLTIPLVK